VRRHPVFTLNRYAFGSNPLSPALSPLGRGEGVGIPNSYASALPDFNRPGLPGENTPLPQRHRFANLVPEDQTCAASGRLGTAGDWSEKISIAMNSLIAGPEPLPAARLNGSAPPPPAHLSAPHDQPAAAGKKSHLRATPTPSAPGSFSVERYTANRQFEWDRFVSGAKNATFLFARDYLDYHRDRFTDHSLLVYHADKLVAVLPANLSAAGTLVSHEGLTYGGLAVAPNATLREVLACFQAVLRDLSQRQITRLLYKRIPGFYNSQPDDETAYALFLLDARLYRRDGTATIAQQDRLPFRKGHHYMIKRALKLGVEIVPENSFGPFWEQVLTPRLGNRYGVKPVHTLAEITRLASRFPRHIKQFSAYYQGEILAGATLFETPTVAHVQYAAATDRGRQSGAQTYLFSALIEQYQDKRFFDFGISNEQQGRALNHGLQEWKEGFGARCYAHDFYEIATSDYVKLDPLL
jgi:hypothetical protein